MQEIIHNSLASAKRDGLVNADDLVVVTAGDPDTFPVEENYSSSTNVMMIAQIH